LHGRWVTWTLAFLAGAWLHATPASAQTIDEQIRALQMQIEALDQQLRILQRKLEIERESEAANGKTAPQVSAGRDGVQLETADNSFQLRLRGLLHSDGRFFADDSARLTTDTWALRRVRPIIDATVYRIFDLRFIPDFGDGRTVIQDAYLDLRFTPALKLRSGKFKSPFGLERLVSASDLLFIERGAPTGVAPNRDVGLMLHGDLRGGDLSYAAGVFNGVVDGGSGDVDDVDGRDVVARVFAQPFRRGENDRLKGLGFGAAASYGKQDGTLLVPGLPTYRTTGLQTFFRYRLDTTDPGSTIANGTRYRWSTQGHYYTGPIGVLAEQVRSSQEVRRGASQATLETDAWQIAASYVLTGEDATYRGVVPRNAFEPSAGTLGAFELTARYHQLTPDQDAFPIFANPNVSASRARAWTAGLNWYLNRNIKVVLDYEQTHFDGGTLEGDRPTEHGIFSRLQFAY
jgi:phosphate-selective porin OprO/OprP